MIQVPGANFTFHELLHTYQQAAQLPAIRDVFSRPADLFYTNYVFTAPLVEAVDGGCRRVLEAVDIISHSFALNERMRQPRRDPLAVARDAFRFRTEMELYQLFDSVLFINEQEARLAEPYHPGHVQYVAPMCPTLGSAGVAQRDVSAEPEDCQYDLLFVGSNHPPNVDGVTWFYKNVYVPYLRERQVSFAIAGTVCSQLNFDDPQVTKLGRFDGPLSELYAQSKLVVIPLFHGSGLSIKTIECLGMGRAAVTTPVGARGMSESPDAFVCLDMLERPRETATAIQQLLDQPERRHQMQQKAQEYFQRHFSAQRYLQAMDRVMESIGLGRDAAVSVA